MQRLLIIAIICTFISCNNAEVVQHDILTDSAKSAKDSVAEAVDTASTTTIDTENHKNTNPQPPQPIATKKSASIAYSYFNTIKRNEVKNINVHLDIKNPESVARAELKAIEKIQAVNGADKDSNFTATLSMPIYDSVEVSLQDPAADYIISKINHLHDKQQVDTIKGNLWGWTVITKTDKKQTTLIIKITAYTPGGQEELDNRSIPIRIQLEQNMLRKLWATLLDDPKYFLTIILVPLIGYLGKKYFDRKKDVAKNS